MSYGFIARGASTGSVSAAVMRGPMVSKVTTQLISGTDWGELDYLVVDLPPVRSRVQSACRAPRDSRQSRALALRDAYRALVTCTSRSAKRTRSRPRSS